MTNVREGNRRRFSLSMLVAFVFHCLIFVAFLRLIPLNLQNLSGYSGPIAVTIGEFEQAVPEGDVSGARGGQPAEETVTIAPKAAPEKQASLKPAFLKPAPAKQASAPMPIPEKPSPAPEEQTSPLPRENIDRLEVTKNLVSVPTEQSTDVAPPKLTAPEMARQNEKKLPFKPETELAETPLALNLQKLDETLGKTKQDGGGSSVQKSPETAQTKGKKGPGKGAGPVTGTGSRPGAGTVSGSSGAPVIAWENAGAQRSLLSAGPPPDIPQWVKKEGIDLKVVVSFSVTAEGQTTLVSTALSSGYTDVDSAVLDSVRKMKFNPVRGADLAKGKVTYIIRTK
jgi:TonB family protein